MDSYNYIQFFLALIFVLGLFGVMVVVARKYGLGHRMVARPGAEKRLGVVEVMPLDAKRRLLLIQRDTTQHLIILGPEGETVVESGITAPPKADFASLVGAETGQEARP